MPVYRTPTPDFQLIIARTFPTRVHVADDTSPRGKFYAGAVIKWTGKDDTFGHVAVLNWGPGMDGGDFQTGQLGTYFFQWEYDASQAVLKKLRSKESGGYEERSERLQPLIPVRVEQLILSKLKGIAASEDRPEAGRKPAFYSGANFEANALTILGTSTPAGIDLLVNMRADMQAWRADLDRADAALSLAQDAIRDRLIKGDEA